ncbi:hypothetical protein BX600DRAFT_511821 [Xylariales sp. PMI_506]|nr:hypothetical protein BX600DRAFT_511821 [Xylariales sp. PMI_506]
MGNENLQDSFRQHNDQHAQETPAPYRAKHGTRPTRKLVTVRHITDLVPLKRYQVDIAIVGGWNVVVRRGSHTVGELVVYFEIDSFLPASNQRFWKYGASEHYSIWNGKHGYVVCTTMIHGQISQGLIFGLDEFPEIKEQGARLDTDYSGLLGVKKYEPEDVGTVDSSWNLCHGAAPIFFPKPGCERAQNIANLFERYSDTKFIITEKLDGVPMIVYSVDRRSPWYKALPQHRVKGSIDVSAGATTRPAYGVCSREQDFMEQDRESPFWSAARAQQLVDKVGRIAGVFNRPASNSWAVTGELCGADILGNSMGFEQGQRRFYAFSVYDIDRQRCLTPERALRVCRRLGIEHAPVVAPLQMPLGDFAQSTEELLAGAEGVGVLGRPREGLVFRAVDLSITFKVIANSWLLQHGKRKAVEDQW